MDGQLLWFVALRCGHTGWIIMRQVTDRSIHLFLGDGVSFVFPRHGFLP